MSIVQPPPPLCGGADHFDVCVSFNVTNTGARDGADVPQLYVTPFPLCIFVTSCAGTSPTPQRQTSRQGSCASSPR
jgi:hypothetical protein